MPDRLAIRFARSRHRPGDAIDGVLVALDSTRAREVTVALRYLERSEDYSGGEVHAGPIVLHAGAVRESQEFPFSLRLPADALPGWEDELPGARLYWGVHAKIDVPRGFDILADGPFAR